LVVLSLVTNIYTDAYLDTYANGVRAAASSWKPRGLHADADVH